MTYTSHRWRAARRPHTCDLCARSITRGETYDLVTSFEVGVDRCAECIHCWVFRHVATMRTAEETYERQTLFDFEPLTSGEEQVAQLWQCQWRDPQTWRFVAPPTVVSYAPPETPLKRLRFPSPVWSIRPWRLNDEPPFPLRPGAWERCHGDASVWAP